MKYSPIVCPTTTSLDIGVELPIPKFPSFRRYRSGELLLLFIFSEYAAEVESVAVIFTLSVESVLAKVPKDVG